MEVLNFVASREYATPRRTIKRKKARHGNFFTCIFRRKKIKSSPMNMAFMRTSPGIDANTVMFAPDIFAEKAFAATRKKAKFSRGSAVFLFAILFSCCAATGFAFFLSSRPAQLCVIPIPKGISEGEIALLDSAIRRLALHEGEGIESEDEISAENDSTASFVLAEPVVFKNYTVQTSDNVTKIAKKFGLKNISSIISINGISNAKKLYVGKKLKIPSMDGISYKVKAQDSLSSIASKYNISVETIVDINDLSSELISVGTELFIPGATMPQSELKKALGNTFSFPLPKSAFKYRSSNFGWRSDPFTGARSYHTGVDLVAKQGTPIRACMDGKVAVAGWSNVYGNYVIIDHGNGYQTLYAHMVKYTVKKGQRVEQGQQIGKVGSTGYSTGPHLHLTVYKNGKLTNPNLILPKY